MREELIELLKEAMVLSDGICRIVGNTQAKAIGHYLFAHGVTIPVRCKDCKYAENMMPIDNGNGYLMGDCILRKEDDIIVTAWEDEFCSYGERKKE